MYAQFLRHLLRGVAMYARKQPGKLRQMMNATHELGLMRGLYLRAHTDGDTA